MLLLSERSLTSPNTVHQIDALSLMRAQGDSSIDAIITDLPYGTTACSWDVIIPFAPMWEQVKRILKPRGVFVTTASQPFTSTLICSNLTWFHEELVWNKVLAKGFLDANRKHLKEHENIIVFCDGMPTYNPQMAAGEYYTRPPRGRTDVYGTFKSTPTYGDGRYPKTILIYSNADQTNKKHPTQKPVALYEYLIRTYTNEGDTVLDMCAGSGTTAVAARNTKRQYIIGDTSTKYLAEAKDRLRLPFEQKQVKKESDVSDLPLFTKI